MEARIQVWSLIRCIITVQIHDEVIVEGPDESKEEALAEVRLDPFQFFLSTYSPSLPPCLRS